jgi:RNA polymerase sigma-70 factor (ECF subfamily)
MLCADQPRGPLAKRCVTISDVVFDLRQGLRLDSEIKWSGLTSMETTPSETRGPAAFRTTHWTVVLEAAHPDADRSREAFARIYLDYWYPLYAYVRRRGFPPPDAEDILQSFFLHLLEKQSLEGMERDGGRFRSFLLRSLDNFLANRWDRARAQKRGEGVPLLSLNATDGETRFLAEPSVTETPQTLFERQWIFTLLARVLDDLQAECEAGGKGRLFADLRLHLQGDRQGPPYAEVAARHGLSEGAVKVTVHRLRQRYGEMLRGEVARTVGSAEEVDEELRHFIAVSAR